MNKTLFMEQAETWVLEKLQADPYKFGGDNGNSLITLAYLQEVHKGVKVENLTIFAMKGVSSVSRAKNNVLLRHPELDHRKINKLKKKKIGITSTDRVQG